MKKILAFAGSNNSKSINQLLINFTAAQFSDIAVSVLDIRKWDVPIYSLDMDPDETPELITSLIGKIDECDGFIIASPEHNGGTPAFLKNIIDWLSRRAKKVFTGKPLLLLSTSPGANGGATNLKYLVHSMPFQGAQVVGSFSLPSFYENLKEGEMDAEYLSKLNEGIDALKAAVS